MSLETYGRHRLWERADAIGSQKLHGNPEPRFKWRSSLEGQGVHPGSVLGTAVPALTHPAASTQSRSHGKQLRLPKARASLGCAAPGPAEVAEHAQGRACKSARPWGEGGQREDGRACFQGAASPHTVLSLL